MNKQKGIIPMLVIVALVLSSLLGGMIGIKLGDGSVFSFGLGFGLVFVLFIVLAPHIEKVIAAFDKIMNRLRKSND